MQVHSVCPSLVSCFHPKQESCIWKIRSKHTCESSILELTSAVISVMANVTNRYLTLVVTSYLMADHLVRMIGTNMFAVTEQIR